MSNNWVRSLAFAAVGITLIVVILLAASVFAAPEAGYSGAIVGGSKHGFGNPSSTTYLTYYSSSYGYQARVVVALGNNITIVASTGGNCSFTGDSGIYYVVGAVDSSNNHYAYIYDSTGHLAKSCQVASGNAYTYISANGVQVIYLKYFSTSATSGGFQEALNYYVNNIDPAVNNAGSGNIVIVWGNFSGNLPVTLNFTVNGAEINAFTWGGGSGLETYWLIESNESVGVETNHYNFTAALGKTYNIYDENWAEAGSSSAGQENLTLEVYAYDEYTGKNVSGDVYINGSLAGKTFETLTVPNATLDVKIIASGYESKEFLTAPGRVIVYLKPYSQPSEKVNVTFTAYDAETGDAVDATFSEGFTSWHSGQRVQMAKGYHTVSVSASGYKPLRFTVFLSGDAEIPVYLVKQGSNASGGVGYNPAHSNITNTNSPDPATYGGCHVGFHMINPSDAPVQVSIIAKTYGDAILTGYIEHRGVIDQFTVPPHSGTYVAYDLHDVAWRVGHLIIVYSCDINRARLYEFTVVANGKKVAVLKGDVAFNNYVDVYVAPGGNGTWTAGWGISNAVGGTGNEAMMKMLGQLMPLLIIVLIFGLISQALKRR